MAKFTISGLGPSKLNKRHSSYCSVADSLKARVMLSLSYGCGLRAGEVVRSRLDLVMSAPRLGNFAVLHNPPAAVIG
jgi:hypothetical protein